MSRMPGGRIIAALAIGLTLLAAPLRATDGELVVIDKFGVDNGGLVVAHYTAANVERSKSKVGLIVITSSSTSSGENSFAFNLAEWRTLMQMSDKAIAAQSIDWAVVGSMTETGTSDISHLTMSSGPGVRFVIASRRDGQVSYVLAKSDLSRLQGALRAVEVFLAAP